MDLAFAEVQRLEKERRLRSIPSRVLESSPTLEAQVEAVIDAVLTATLDDNMRAYVHARNAGEWAARIAEMLPEASSARFARRCTVLADCNPTVLERLPELRPYAPTIRAFQRAQMSSRFADSDGDPIDIDLLVMFVAQQFDDFIVDAATQGRSLRAAMTALKLSDCSAVRRIASALERGVDLRHSIA